MFVRYVPARIRRAYTSEASDQAAMLSRAQVAAERGVDERTVRRSVTAGVVPSQSIPAGHHLLALSRLRV